MLALARDVSVERARERAVAGARDRAEKLVLSAPHGIAVMRRDEPTYSTTAREVTDISIVSTRERRSWGGCELSLGEVDVSHQVVSFLKRRQPGGEVLAEEGRHGFELLQKPYAAEELSRVLRRVTRRRRPA